MSAAYDVSGKVALITGGTGGIGRATARELLARGAQVAIADIDLDTPDIAKRMSPAVLGVVADVRDRDSLDAAVARVVDRFGRLDIVVANAGVLSRAGTLRTTPPATVDGLFAVNVNGVVNTIGAAMDQVIAHRGQIVLLSSVFAFLNGMGTIPYAMSKAAVEQLGRGLRVELAPHGVTTTTVYFSLIDTPMIRHGVDDDAAATELLSTLPRALLTRLRPEAAATAIVDGIAKRSPRVMVPGRWKPFSALRGLIGPALDSRLTTDHRTQTALAALDDPRREIDTVTSETTTWKTAPTRTVDVGGVPFVYRELGPEGGVPVVFFHHLTATLDDWDPRVVDGIAERHRVIAFDNRGIGATGSTVPHTLDEMGADGVAFIRALGHDQVDLFGFSLGGAVAQMVALQAPDLVRRIVLAGTGPRGGGGIEKMPLIVGGAYLKAALSRKDARHFLFFPRDTEGKQAANAYFHRLAERRIGRDTKISQQAKIAQLRAIVGGARHEPDDLSTITVPVLVANGDNDLMVSTEHSRDLAARLPDSRLIIYPNSGHGGIFQHHQAFVPEVLSFLAP